MCDDQADAAQPTHTVIRATFRLDESSRLVVPTPHPITSTSTSLPTDDPTTRPPTNERPTTSERPTTTDSPITVTTSLSKTSSEPTETQTAPTPGDAEESGDEESDSSSLGTAEIAGLAAGLSAAVVIALLLICLARRRRKKHYPDVETSFFMTNDRLKALSRRFTVLPRGDNISAPLHGSPNAAPKEFPMGEFGAMESRSQAFVVPRTHAGAPALKKVPSGMASPVAGLAVTAASAVPMAAGGPSTPRDSRQRPVLSLAIPETRADTAASQRKPAPKRDESPPSILVTAPTFKPEDTKSAAKAKASKPTVPSMDEDDSPLTEFEEDDRDSPIQIWRPPSAAPQSATTLYVADKFGNWVLADERQKKRISLAELEGSSPIVSRGGNDVFALGPSPSAGETSKASAAALRPPAEIYKRGEQRRDMQSMASSVYSSDVPAWGPSAPPLPTNPLMPRPLNSRAGPPHPRQRYSPVLNPFLDDNGISPVRSVYGSTRRAYATPRAGARRGQRSMRSPPGQPSPTLGVTKPAGHTASNARRPPAKPQTPQPRAYSPVPPVPPAAPTAPAPSPAQSTPTSLLAKRVGPEKAASLSLRDSEASRGNGGSGDSWGSGRRGQLPSTPTWNPLMTPERRGDDLYLSIR